MSKMQHWRTNPDEELARIVKRDELTTFWNNNIDIVIGPGETLVWIRNGKIDDSITQQRLNNIAGGFLKWLGKKMSTGKDVQMLIVDNKPFQIEIGVQGNTGDGVEQTGMATAVLRLNSEEANLILGQLREKAVLVKKGILRKRMEIDHYETVLTRSDIEQMVAPEARAKVFVPIIHEYSGRDIGSKKIVDEVSNRALIELRKTLGTWGMGLENIYVNWDANAYQAWKSDRAPRDWETDAEREQRKKDLDFKRLESNQEMDELAKMMEMKEQINKQKMARKKAAAESELELEKVKGQTEVEKAKHSLETYEKAQEKESDKMIRMMRAMKGLDEEEK